MNEELIVVRQLPEIEEHLRAFKETIEARVADATSMVCTEDTLNSVKKARADLNAEFKVLEAKRIAVKKQILAPYDAFEAVYKECVSDPFKRGEALLKSRVDEVELLLKDEKEARIVEYFTELCTAKALHFVKYEDLGINVTRSVSDKKLKEQVKEKLDRIEDDIALIHTQEFSEEIMVEYQRSLDAAGAIVTVKERHEAIEREKKRAEEMALDTALREAAAASVDAIIEKETLAPPTVVADSETTDAGEDGKAIYKVTFTVTGTKEQIRALKDYMTEKGLNYNG